MNLKYAQTIHALLVVMIFPFVSRGQSVIKPDSTVLKKDIIRSDKEVVLRFPVTVDTDKLDNPVSDYIIKLKANTAKSTLPQKDYVIAPDSLKLNTAVKDYIFYLTIKSDIKRHDAEDLSLDIFLYKKDTVKADSTVNFTVKSVSSIQDFSYLAFLGTNFDLVEGIKPRNLYFGANMFSRPDEKHHLSFGFNFYLYGNRTISTSDTSGRVNVYDRNIVPIDDSTYRLYRYSTVQNTTYTSDNIGANISPLMYIIGFSNISSSTKLYYAPQFEFIWRRMQSTITASDKIFIDSFDFSKDTIATLPYFSENSILSFNRYDWYLNPIALMLVHENANISVKIQAGFGWRYSYIPNNMGYFEANYKRDSVNTNIFVRAWITEPLTGISLGAEATNLIYGKCKSGNIYQPFYNVTLSKAFHIHELVGFFSPLTKRD